jgi:Arc/MetJ-type ribon-helix-helix transcriptional regulator
MPYLYDRSKMATPVVSLRLKPELDAKIAKAVEAGTFASRSEAITQAVERMFEEARQ